MSNMRALPPMVSDSNFRHPRQPKPHAYHRPAPRIPRSLAISSSEQRRRLIRTLPFPL